jgi:PLP dependent protein
MEMESRDPRLCGAMPDRGAALRKVQDGIARACARVSRDVRAVSLVAASKTVSADMIAPLIELGQVVYGENRVQEAKSKWPALKERFPEVELHLLGPLQSNKAREAVSLCEVIQSLDRRSLAEALARECQRQARAPKLFIQVNTGLESQKAGVAPGDADAFVAECRNVWGLNVQGLMCIPPVGDRPEKHFLLLAELARRNGLGCLSMGMSADFMLAIEHGATHVRVGSAIFGSRPKLEVAT